MCVPANLQGLRTAESGSHCGRIGRLWKIDPQVFDLERSTVEKRPLGPGSDRTAEMETIGGRLKRRRSGTAWMILICRYADVAPRQPAGEIDESVIPSIAEPRTQRAEIVEPLGQSSIDIIVGLLDVSRGNICFDAHDPIGRQSKIISN